MTCSTLRHLLRKGDDNLEAFFAAVEAADVLSILESLPVADDKSKRNELHTRLLERRHASETEHVLEHAKSTLERRQKQETALQLTCAQSRCVRARSLLSAHDSCLDGLCAGKDHARTTS